MSKASNTSGSKRLSRVSESSYGRSVETNWSARALSRTPTASSRSPIRTPAQRTSFTYQPVTQWKSEIWWARGIAEVGEREARGRSTRPPTAACTLPDRVRHRVADRVDPPAARRHDCRSGLGTTRPTNSVTLPGEEQPGHPEPDETEESRTPDRTITHDGHNDSGRGGEVTGLVSKGLASGRRRHRRRIVVD